MRLLFNVIHSKAKIMDEKKYSILAVDDEPDVLDVLERALEDDYSIFTAPNGEAALDILRQEEIDLLITDQRMPKMSGVKLLEEAKKINPSMIRIILTGYTEPDDMIGAINRGEVYRYITKPWDLNDLTITIKNALEAYQLRKDKERLVSDLEMRLNAMTVFLDLSKEAAGVGSYSELVQAIVRYLPYIVDFDACASLVEQGLSGKAILNIHCRKPLHEDQLFDVRKKTLQAYRNNCGKQVAEEKLLIQLTGEKARPESLPKPFASTVHVVLLAEGEPTGIIQLFAEAEGYFREDTQQLLDIVANHTSEIIMGLRKQMSTQRQRLELMVQSLADGVIMVDDENQVFVINPAARRLLRLPPDKPMDARYLKDTLGFYPFDLVRGWPVKDGAIIKEEIKVFDRILHSIVSPVSLDDQIMGVAVVLRDITEDKQLEERKEEFVSIISHELRTPLTSIGGALDLLLHRFAGEINPKQEHYMKLAKGGCEKLNTIIDDLLDLSRFEKGKMMMEMRAISLTELVRQAVDQYQAAAQEKQVQLKLDLAEKEAEVFGDRNRLHQVLNNLLSNALKFVPAGGMIKVSQVVSDSVPNKVGVSVFNDG